MPLYRDEGVVLRTHKLGEADRIITLLTREHGRVRAVAKGVRRTSSKFGARLEPFMHIDVQLYIGKSLDIVTQVETLNAFARPLAIDYQRYTAGTAMLETAERLTAEEREPAVQQYLLLVGGLPCARHRRARPDARARRVPPPVPGGRRVRAVVRRVRTLRRPRPAPFFAVATGGMVCGVCRPPGAVTPASDTVDLLAALLTGDWAAADASEQRHRTEASGIVAAYLQWHLERGLRSLPYVDRTPTPRVPLPVRLALG